MVPPLYLKGHDPQLCVASLGLGGSRCSSSGLLWLLHPIPANGHPPGMLSPFILPTQWCAPPLKIPVHT